MKLRAVIQGRTLHDLVAEFLRQGLGLSATLPASIQMPTGMVMLGTGDLPVIRCRADAPAAQMGPQDLLALEQQMQTDEDMGRASSAV